MKIWSIWDKKSFGLIIGPQYTKKIQRFLSRKCCFLPVFCQFFHFPRHRQFIVIKSKYSAFALTCGQYTQKRIIKKYQPSSKIQLIVQGQFFHQKCPLFSWQPSYLAKYVLLLNDPTTSYLFFGVHRHAIGSTKVDIQFGDISF